MAAACKRRGGGRGRTRSSRSSAIKELKNAASGIVNGLTSLSKLPGYHHLDQAGGGTTNNNNNKISNSEVLDPTSSKDKPHLPGTLAEQVDQKTPTMMGSWGPSEQKGDDDHDQVRTRNNLVMHDSCPEMNADQRIVDGHCSDHELSKISSLNTTAGTRTNKELEINSSAGGHPLLLQHMRESEALEPYEWLDGEINRLSYILECGVLEDPFENAAHDPDHKELIRDQKEKISSAVKVGAGLRRNLKLETTSTTDEQEMESSVLSSSNADCGECYDCSNYSINNNNNNNSSSGFDDELMDWNWVGGVDQCHNQWALWDEGDQMLTSCLWEAAGSNVNKAGSTEEK